MRRFLFSLLTLVILGRKGSVLALLFGGLLGPGYS